MVSVRSLFCFLKNAIKGWKRVERRLTPGFVGREVTKLMLDLYPDLRLITTDIIEPPRFIDDEQRLRVVKADLGDEKQIESLFEGEEVGGLIALQ